MIEQDYMKEQWFTLLKEQVEKSSRSQVARELSYSLTAISLVLNGKYNGKTDRLREKVWKKYTQVSCPYTQKVILLQTCVETATAKAPTHNPIKMAQWRACQNCPHCPKT